jgi:hypothetical protein
MRVDIKDKMDSIIAGIAFGEYNTPELREKIATALEKFLQNEVAKDTVEAWTVLCSRYNNTPERISKNELWADVAIRFTGESEFEYFPLYLAPYKLETGDRRVFYIDVPDMSEEDAARYLEIIKAEIKNRPGILDA